MMGFMSREQVENLRKRYPVGTRLRLSYMDDRQAPPVGTLGTVRGVDDAGNILMTWDSGSSLSLVYGEDQFETVTITGGR